MALGLVLELWIDAGCWMLDAGCWSIRRAEMRFIYVEMGGLVEGTPEIDLRYRSLQTPIQPST